MLIQIVDTKFKLCTPNSACACACETSNPVTSNSCTQYTESMAMRLSSKLRKTVATLCRTTARTVNPRDFSAFVSLLREAESLLSAQPSPSANERQQRQQKRALPGHFSLPVFSAIQHELIKVWNVCFPVVGTTGSSLSSAKETKEGYSMISFMRDVPCCSGKKVPEILSGV